MTDRAIYTLRANMPSIREAACKAIKSAPDEYVVIIQEPTRSTDQNSKLWPMLTDISRQVKHHGLTLSPESWKHMFTAALDPELAVVPNLAGTGFVVLGQPTSSMSKRKFGELIEFITAFGAQHDVVWSEKEPFQ